MKQPVDMKYSFLSDDEPTDEQLEVIMQEVATEAKEKYVKAYKEFEERMLAEAEQAYQKLLTNLKK